MSFAPKNSLNCQNLLIQNPSFLNSNHRVALQCAMGSKNKTRILWRVTIPPCNRSNLFIFQRSVYSAIHFVLFEPSRVLRKISIFSEQMEWARCQSKWQEIFLWIDSISYFGQRVTRTMDICYFWHPDRINYYFFNFFRFFMESSEVYSLLIFIQLVCSMVFLACVVFQLDLVAPQFSTELFIWNINGFSFVFQQIQNPSVEAIFILIAVTVSSLNLFIYCYAGKMATDSFAKMAVCLYDANWFELSTELQKYFVLAIANAQRPMMYHGFGIAILNLDTFTNMLKTVLTYYMMFKTVTTG